MGKAFHIMSPHTETHEHGGVVNNHASKHVLTLRDLQNGIRFAISNSGKRKYTKIEVPAQE